METIDTLQITSIHDSDLRISKEEFNKGFIINPLELILGKTPGLVLNSENGSPGNRYSALNFGVGAMAQVQSPLVLIDGIPHYGLPISIHPADIEKISIVTNPGELAQYLTNSNSGIIEIETIKYPRSKFQVNYHGQVAFSWLPRKLDILSAQEYRTYFRSVNTADRSNEMLGEANIDWQDEMFQQVVSNDHFIDFSANVLKGSLPMNFTYGNTQNEGILRSTFQRRQLYKAYVAPCFLKNSLRFDLLFFGQREEQSQDPLGLLMERIVFYNPTIPIYGNDGNYLNLSEEWVNPLEFIDTYGELINIKNNSVTFKSVYDLPFLKGLSVQSIYNRRTDQLNLDRDIRVYFFDFTKKQKIQTEHFSTSINYVNNYKTDIGYQISGGASFNNRKLKDERFAGGVIIFTDTKVTNGFLKYNMWFKEKYSFGANIGYAEDVYPIGHKQGLFSFGAFFSLDLKEMTFFQSLRNISNLKFNLNVSDTEHGYFSDTWFDPNLPISIDARMAREKENQFLYSSKIDIGFLEEKINLSVQHFFRQLNNSRAVSGFRAWEENFDNLGQVNSNGVSLQFDFSEAYSERLRFKVYFNFTHSQNKIKELTEWHGIATYPSSGSGYLTVNWEGEKVGAFDLNHQVYDSDNNPIEGEYDFSIDDLSRTAYPHSVIGVGKRIDFGGFNFGWSGRLSLGNYVFDEISSNSSINMIDGFYDIFNTTNSQVSNNFQQAQRNSDVHLVNGSFFKMDFITFGYRLNDTSRIKTEVNLSVQNLFVLTKYHGPDPEVPTGFDYGNYPRARVISLGANVTF